jgi:hypothetical protein
MSDRGKTRDGISEGVLLLLLLLLFHRYQSYAVCRKRWRCRRRSRGGGGVRIVIGRIACVLQVRVGSGGESGIGQGLIQV